MYIVELEIPKILLVSFVRFNSKLNVTLRSNGLNREERHRSIVCRRNIYVKFSCRIAEISGLYGNRASRINTYLLLAWRFAWRSFNKTTLMASALIFVTIIVRNDGR